jgi:hypothetical protein
LDPESEVRFHDTPSVGIGDGLDDGFDFESGVSNYGAAGDGQRRRAADGVDE